MAAARRLMTEPPALVVAVSEATEADRRARVEALRAQAAAWPARAAARLAQAVAWPARAAEPQARRAMAA